MIRISGSCFVVAGFAVSSLFAQTTTAPLQRGISVQMAVTSNASPVPDADRPDAWVVVLAADGKLFFRTDPVTFAQLGNDMQTHPRDRDAKLYVKADARVPFHNVQRVMETGREVFFKSAVLLTSESGPAQAGTMVPPKGIEVWVDPASGKDGVAVELVKTGRQSPTLKVNNQPIKDSALGSTLDQLLRDREEKVVALRTEGAFTFAQVANVLDVCGSAGAKVVLLDSSSH